MALALYPNQLTPGHLEEAYPSHWDTNLKQTVKLWLKDLQSGARPLTDRSIQTLRERLFRYTTVLKKEFGIAHLTQDACLDLRNLYSVISYYPVEGFSNRHNTFYALYSLARFLIRLGELEEAYLTRMKKLKPKRVVPPKRTVLRDSLVVEQVREAIKEEHYSTRWGYLTTQTLVEMLLQTGIRNAEACNLKLEDVDIANQRMVIRLGKGRKNRSLGIPKGLIGYLEAYLVERQKRKMSTSHFFLNSFDLPLTPTCLGRLIKKVSDHSGVKITSHGLRRTFATLNSEQGKPLHLIQLALGHSDIRTTQEYLMSDQEAVIEAMKDW